MKKRLKRLLACTLALALTVICASPAMATTEVEVTDPDYYTKFQGQNITLNVYNWGEYISDGSDDSLDVNKAFEELTGIKVNYTTFDTNESLYAKLRSGGASYDIIIPSDYMVSKMIQEDMLEKLDFSQIPNFQYIDESYVNPDYDPTNEYSVPYTWGTVGIIYNTNLVTEPVTSWDILWDEDYAGDILMFSNSRDAFGIALKKLGYSMNTEDPDELQEAADLLKEQKPLVQAYVMDQIFDKMQGGEAALAPYYAGDALTMIADSPELAFAVPEEGTNIFFDAICIPKGAKNVEAAHMYINFLCEPEVAAANIEYICYSTPNSAAYELLDEETANSPISYPPQEILDKAEAFVNLSEDTNLLLESLWTEVLTDDQSYNTWAMPLFLAAGILFSIGVNVARRIRKKKEQMY